MPADSIKAMGKLLRACQPRHDLYTLFSDCMETVAIAISNSVDLRQRETREARYLEIVRRYERPVIETFAKILAEVTLALETAPGDVLGRLFGELALGNAARGQFFTPYEVSVAIAKMTLGNGEDARALIERHGFVSAMEPACGSGGMVIALAQAMRERGINYQRHLHVTAIDIDPRAAHMTYIQLSLLHVPAVVIIGNSLTLEHRETWYTPAHILGGWNAKIARRRSDALAAVTTLPVEPAPSVAPPLPLAEKHPGKPQQLSLF
jgi:hypothetical protein